MYSVMGCNFIEHRAKTVPLRLLCKITESVELATSTFKILALQNI